jgi:hypothetical protein
MSGKKILLVTAVAAAVVSSGPAADVARAADSAAITGATGAVGKSAPGKTAATATVTQTISAAQTFSTGANTQAQDVQIPVPAGLAPKEVTGRLLFDTDADGTVEILADNSVVSRVDKKPADRELPLTFPVTSGDVQSGLLRFSIRYLAGPPAVRQQTCIPNNLGNVQLVGVHVGLTGTASPPTTVAGFFGRAVSAVSIRVPGQPDRDLQQAALTAEAAIASVYGTQAQVTVTTPATGSRAVRVTPVQGRVVQLVPGQGQVRSAITTTDGVPVLTLTGDPAKLPAAAAALGSDLLSLADTPRVTRLEQSGTVAGPGRLTLASLGQDAPRLSGLGQSQIDLNVTQSQFGSPVSSVKIHLVGQHTPIPGQISATLSYYWNGQLVASQLLDRAPTTQIDQAIVIPATQLQSANTLTLRLDAVPSGGGGGGGGNGVPFDCAGPLSYLPVVASFDGKASTLTPMAGPPADPGFQVFPQALANHLTIAFGSDRPADSSLTDAAALVGGLARINFSQFDVRVTGAQSFIGSSTPGLLVDATPDQVLSMRAPLAMAEFRSIDTANPDFGAGVSQPFAALQAFEQNSRNVLVLGSYTPPGTSGDQGSLLASKLADSVATSPNGWYDLNGNLAVQLSASGTVIKTEASQIRPQPERLSRFNWYVLWLIVAVIALGILYVSGLLARRRLRRRAGKLVDAQQSPPPSAEEK